MIKWRKAVTALLILSMISQEALSAGPFRWWRKDEQPKKTEDVACEQELKPQLPEAMPEKRQISAVDALRMLHEDIPVLLRERNLLGKPPPWTRVIDQYLWPFMRSESKELTVAVLGPGNSGKSTFFNALPRIFYQTQDINQTQPLPTMEVSKVEFSAGRTARPVFLMSSELAKKKNQLELRFGTLDGWTDSYSSTKEGNPIFYPVDHFFKNVIFVDTPSFDIRPRKALADQVFVWSDIIFYVFSGSNYKNDLNLQIMRDKFKDIGPHKVALIYRVNPNISQEEAFNHFYEIAHEIFPGAVDDPDTRLPSAIIGTYIMTESDRVTTKETVPEFIALNNSPELPSLLADFDDRYEHFRRGALESSLEYVLDGASEALHDLQRNTEELALTEKAFDLLLIQTVKEVVGVFPYHRLGGEVQELWFERSNHGLRGFARWIGQPHRMFRRRRADINIRGEVLADLEAYSNSVVERAVSNFMLAGSRGLIEIKENVPDVKKFMEEIDEFRAAHRIPADQPPSYRKLEDGRIEFKLSQSPDIKAKIEEYLNRDWATITQQVKQEAKNSLNDLTIQIQGEMQQVANFQLRRQKITSRVAQALYPVIAVAPFLAAAGYIIYSPDVNLVEYRGLLSVIGSMIFANLVMRLDERSVRQAWNNVIDDWYGTRQGPRLIDILRKRLRFKPTPTVSSPQAVWSIERIQMALETLSQRRLPLIPGEDPQPPEPDIPDLEWKE